MTRDDIRCRGVQRRPASVAAPQRRRRRSLLGVAPPGLDPRVHQAITELLAYAMSLEAHAHRGRGADRTARADTVALSRPMHVPALDDAAGVQTNAAVREEMASRVRAAGALAEEMEALHAMIEALWEYGEGRAERGDRSGESGRG